jgi:hypothetical protein
VSKVSPKNFRSVVTLLMCFADVKTISAVICLLVCKQILIYLDLQNIWLDKELGKP